MIIDLQRRLAEIGRIRIGQQVPSGNGKRRPEKLATFRLTSPDQLRIEHAARLYGGKPGQWDAPAGRQWEVITTTDVLDVIVPPSDMAFSQHYELWSAGGCQRRCDGAQEAISDGPCLCDPDERECDIHTRLSVMLRDLPGLGVWRIDTSGYYAAVELQGAVAVIQIAAARGQMLPARLRLEQRQVKRPDQPVRRFAVPVLDVEVSPGQLMGGVPGHLPAVNGHTPAAALDGSAPLTPVPAALPSAPVRSIADQAQQVEHPAGKPKRRNAAQPVPATGLQPRTAAQAAAQAAAPAEPPARPRRGRQGLTGLLIPHMERLGFTERDERLIVTARVAGRDELISSTADLTDDECRTAVNVVSRCRDKESLVALLARKPEVAATDG